jgi:NarL family two-component system response regulator LiaR
MPGAWGEILLYAEWTKEDRQNVPNPAQRTLQEPIRVLITDDPMQARAGLRLFLLAFDDLELVGEAASGEEALDLCARVRPDVVLMDLLVPGLDAACLTCAIRQRFPEIHIIALTSFGAEKTAQGVLKAGASGFILKNVSAAVLAEAIRAAHAGQALPSSDAS